MVFLGVSVAPTVAMAFPGADEMAANFATCNASDESWYRRFGQYVVAFDSDDAIRACSEQTFGPQRPRLTGCSTDAGFIWAGYYCEEVGSKDGAEAAKAR